MRWNSCDHSNSTLAFWKVFQIPQASGIPTSIHEMATNNQLKLVGRPSLSFGNCMIISPALHFDAEAVSWAKRRSDSNSLAVM